MQGDLRSHKMLNNRLPGDFPMHLFASESTDRTMISASTPVTREEPTSTMNHESDRNFKFDNHYRLDEGSPTDSYDENGEFPRIPIPKFCSSLKFINS